MTTEEERYRRARRRARELRAFYTHVVTYVVVIGFLFFVDARDHGNWWVYWPAMGWGIAVVMHAVQTFTTGWEKRTIKKLMERDEDT
jgi:hypothetical protein